MGVVEHAVEDRVRDRGIAQVLVPLGGRELAGDDGRSIRVAVFDDLEQVVAIGLLGRRKACPDREGGWSGDVTPLYRPLDAARLRPLSFLSSHDVSPGLHR